MSRSEVRLHTAPIPPWSSRFYETEADLGQMQESADEGALAHRRLALCARRRTDVDSSWWPAT